MLLPEETQKLIEKYLFLVSIDDLHNLQPWERLALFKSFGPTNHTQSESFEIPLSKMSQADKMIAWLGVITSQYVLPLWENLDNKHPKDHDETESYDPTEMLWVTTQFLQGKMTYEEANHVHFLNKFYYGTAQIEDFTVKEVFCVIEAAYYALGVTLWGWKDFITVNYQLRETLVNDFADYAMQAYAGTDRNKPGVWAIADYDYFKRPADFKPFEIDNQKKLEFWRWWLSEAIPQAWELATQS